jgi:hypothetical protein
MTRVDPARNSGFISKPNKKTLKTVETTIAILVANPLIILSAYFITTATRRPPKAWFETTIHVRELNPNKIP